MEQETQRRFVGPLCIVDGKDQRDAFGDIRDEPVQTVQRGECDVTYLPRGGNVGEYRRGEPRRTGQEPGALFGVNPEERGFEQLANNPETEPTLEFPSACGPHGYPQRAGTIAKLI